MNSPYKGTSSKNIAIQIPRCNTRRPTKLFISTPKRISKKSNRLKGHIWNLARHSYNPYTVGRTLWKAIAVPATTYADGALAYSSETIKCLERHQIELGRWLLGGGMATANAAVSGEMSWFSYKARGARSKIQSAGRLKFMANTD
ncbi:hypothetical protein HPB49_005284 [Dermacentor silvarum]|uniref:Uncharacterized protein n=1 Tax=Dermacentor silvarum TaxID=543639 RepID=A0ACB8C2A2_DERSI|nr:hypothetical protein HPB49_005284 [Dermacentor silvarum]